MKSWTLVSAVMSVMASVALIGCDLPPPQCTRLCDRLYYAEEFRADTECGGLDTSSSDTKEACRDACADTWDDSAEDSYDKDRCLSCISDNIGSRPCWERVAWVIDNDCDDKCGSGFNFSWNEFACSWIAELEYSEEPCTPDECVTPN
jgi:hypothetical protein